MTPVILYRRGSAWSANADHEELAAAQEHFPCIFSRMEVKEDQLVIGRYSVLPFYKELEEDVLSRNARLINAYSHHLYVADLQNWVADLGELTPMTWDRLDAISDEGPFVLKGETNSKKFDWKTHMFAADRREAGRVYDLLCKDGVVGQQKIYIRKYVPLTTYLIDLVGLPVTKEFRFFVYNGEILCGGYYWSNHIDILETIGGVPRIEDVPRTFLDEVLRRVGKNAMFYTLDVAETAYGEWIVIELNDAQMSGLSLNDPMRLYSRLSERLK